jgi:hypothetical protein
LLFHRRDFFLLSAFEIMDDFIPTIRQEVDAFVGVIPYFQGSRGGVIMQEILTRLRRAG